VVVLELLGLWLLMSFVVAGVAIARGRFAFGWWLYALLIWPVALIHVLALPKTAQAIKEEREALAKREGRVPCPFCAELILRQAVICPHCRSELTPADKQSRQVGPAAVEAGTAKPVIHFEGPVRSVPQFQRRDWILFGTLAFVAIGGAVAYSVLT
jgi:uncharacterized paraquat-inducible protein A